MADTRKYIVNFRRKRNKKTNYKKRLSLLLSNKPRVVIRKSLNNTYIQIVSYLPQGDKIITSANAGELKKLGWKAHTGNIPAAYLCGLLAAKKAIQKKTAECVLDFGMNKSIKGSRIYSALKGLRDGGLKVSLSEEVLPEEERASGMHIVEYANKLKENKEKYEKVFSNYLKQGLAPEELKSNFDLVKKKIME